jgi:hypothetical protein
MAPKKYDNPLVCLLNIELELKAERDNAEIRVDNVEVGVLSLFCASVVSPSFKGISKNCRCRVDHSLPEASKNC